MSRTNEDWTRQLKAGHDVAVAELRDVLLRRLKTALSSRPGVDASFLEDAVQIATLRILDRIDQFQGRSRFLTWATSIAINVAFGELRRRHWQDVSLDDVVTDIALPMEFADPTQVGPDVLVEQKALVTSLHERIQTDLTDKQRTALLAELKGMPQSEIAEQLGMTKNALYKLTHDARKKLRAGMEASGYSDADFILS